MNTDRTRNPGVAGASFRYPFHIRRHLANLNRVPLGHFSILTEVTYCLIAPLDALGYELPERLWPDISSGILFSRFLKEELGIEVAALPSYVHVFEDGRRPVAARCYPDELLARFRRYFQLVWLVDRASTYFAERDASALPFLEQFLRGRIAA